MSPLQILFSGYGRIGRLTYFGYSVLSLLVFFALTIAGFSNWGDGASPFALIGVTIVVVALLGTMWTGIALSVKRLHDLGLSGAHLIWIYGIDIALQGVASNGEMSSPGITLVLALLALGVKLCLLLAPGQPDQNAYGQPPA